MNSLNKPFIHDDFMLQNDLAKTLYHQYVKDLPIIDFHTHLSPKAIYEDKPFTSLSHIWLADDHYKWRLLRTDGIDEAYITGSKSDEEKLHAWAKTVPHLFGNPVFHWTQLELKRYFNIDELLDESTAKQVMKSANNLLSLITPRQILSLFSVETICTTDDPIDNLRYHELLQQDKNCKTTVLPTFRPDKLLHPEDKNFSKWIRLLGRSDHHTIEYLDDLKMVISHRIDYFHQHGCRLSDHALDNVFFETATDQEIEQILFRAIHHETLTKPEIHAFQTHMMIYLSELYQKYGWVSQLHIGAYRNVNQSKYKQFGPDSGFDGVQDQTVSTSLGSLLSSMQEHNALPKTIIYTLNANQYDVLLPLIQAFQGEGKRGRIQFGSAWWFLDSVSGIRRQMNAYMNYGVFSTFIGMLTDSRSFMSFPRHEYFRRVLCQVVSEEVNQGYYPNDIKKISELVQNISYYNASSYFAFPRRNQS